MKWEILGYEVVVLTQTLLPHPLDPGVGLVSTPYPPPIEYSYTPPHPSPLRQKGAGAWADAFSSPYRLSTRPGCAQNTSA